jgi:hypothetical protein
MKRTRNRKGVGHSAEFVSADRDWTLVSCRHIHPRVNMSHALEPQTLHGNCRVSLAVCVQRIQQIPVVPERWCSEAGDSEIRLGRDPRAAPQHPEWKTDPAFKAKFHKARLEQGVLISIAREGSWI